MNKRSFLPLLGFIIAIILLYISAEFSGIGESSWGLISLTSALITFGTAFALYLGSFFRINRNPKNIMLFRMRWMRDVLMLTGMIGAMLGIIIMSSISLEGEYIAIGLSAALVATLYGFFGAVSFYFIGKYIEKINDEEKFEKIILKPGINFRSITGIVIIKGMLFMAIFLAATANESEAYIFNIFFSMPILYFLVAVILTSIFLFKGKIVLHALLIAIIKTSNVLNNTIPALKAIRDLKRIVSLFGIVAVSATPIIIIATFGSIDELSTMFGPIGKSGAILSLAMFLLLFLFLVEGQLVQMHYCTTGEIDYDDRFFLIKYVVPSFLILFFSMWLAFIFQLFA